MADGSRFLRTAYERHGLGGEGYLWFGAPTLAHHGLWENDPVLSSNHELRERILKGLFASSANGQSGDTGLHEQYVRRRQQLSPLIGGGASCSLETDDDGNFLWLQDHDDNPNTPLRCNAYDLSEDGTMDAFGYDAVLAVAHALHELIEGRNTTSVSGTELRNLLIRQVNFEGVTGTVSFFDATSDIDQMSHGDRRSGFSYALHNYVPDSGLVLLGVWSLCSSASQSGREGSFGSNAAQVESCPWSQGWRQEERQPTYSTADNRQPAELPPQRVTEVRIGALLPVFLSATAGYARASQTSRLAP
eukprot:5424277-Prymnesium_polylepis.1